MRDDDDYEYYSAAYCTYVYENGRVVTFIEKFLIPISFINN